MAFPASTGALSDALERACRTAQTMKSQVQSFVALSAAQPVGALEIIELHRQLRGYHATLTAVAQTTGIGAYAQAQLGDAEMDVAAEFTAMLSAITNATDWIAQNFPKGTGGYALAFTFGAAGPAYRQFTSAELAGLRTGLGQITAAVA